MVTGILLLRTPSAKKAATEAAKKAPVAPTAVTVERPWTFRTLEIPVNGLAVYLHQGWKGWPKGGVIIITTPGGQVFRDQPGVDNDIGSPGDGIYIFLADPKGSERKVEILNRW